MSVVEIVTLSALGLVGDTALCFVIVFSRMATGLDWFSLTAVPEIKKIS